MICAQVEFGRRADHPVGGAAVRLAGRDPEVPWQDGAGKRHHHEVTDNEVRCPADDVNRLRSADVDLDRPDRLLELGEFLDLGDASDGRGPVTGPTGMTSSTSWPMRISVCSSSSADTSQPGAPAWTTSRSQLYGSRIRLPPRTAARTGRRPRPCHACRECRCGTAACAPAPCRTRTPSTRPDQCRRRATHSG